MGRYTSVQTFGDQNTQLIVDKAVNDAATNNPTDEADGRKATDDVSEDKKRGRLEVEKVSNTTGSCAGASSSEFDIYRKARRIEAERWEHIEKQDEEERKIREYAEKVSRNREEAELKTSKNAAKRQKKKEKLKMMKSQNSATSDS